MPLSINVGLSRKASKDFQSSGCSINVTAELDQTLLTRPAELQHQIDDLFHQAEQAIDRHAQAPNPPPPIHRPSHQPQRAPSANGESGGSNGNGHASRFGNGNDYPASAGSNGNGRPMTDNQRRAIFAIARRANIDPEAECRDLVGVELDELTLRQASELINHLKGTEPSGNGW